MRIVISYEVKWGILFWIKLDGKSMEAERTTWLEFHIRGKAIEEEVEVILVSGEINKSERAGLWESQPGNQVGKLTIWVRSLEMEKS